MSFDKINNLSSELLHEKIFLTCQRVPDKTALKSSEDPKRYFTFDDIKIISGKVSSLLINKGMEPHDKVGLLSENCPEWGIAYLSVLTAGGVVVPFDPALTPVELAHLLSISKIKLLNNGIVAKIRSW